MPPQRKSRTSRASSTRGKKPSSTGTAPQRKTDQRASDQEAIAWSVVPTRPSGKYVTAKEISTALTLAKRLDRPIRIPPERRLVTGLADYAMWQRILKAAPKPPPWSGDTRAGRIWA